MILYSNLWKIIEYLSHIGLRNINKLKRTNYTEIKEVVNKHNEEKWKSRLEQKKVTTILKIYIKMVSKMNQNNTQMTLNLYSYSDSEEIS